MQLRDIFSARDFNEVAALFENGHKWRTHPKDPNGEHVRSLGANCKKFVNIRKIEHGYALRYHDTDVVTWMRDPAGGRDKVTVRGWDSLSTNTFANAFTPSNLTFDMAKDDGYYVHVRMPGEDPHTRVYEFTHTITFSQDPRGVWVPNTEDCVPMRFIDTRSSVLSVCLKKTNYPDFAKWLGAVVSFDNYAGKVPRSDLALRDTVSEADQARREHGVLGLLADPNNWMHLRFLSDTHHQPKYGHSVIGDAEAVKAHVRREIYKAANVPPTHEVPWMPAKQFDQQRKLANTYNWV
jgi:hypothetical protein